jgi:hypothetical protein
MPNAAILGDQLVGNIVSGSITNCRYASQVYSTKSGAIAFVGDQVTVTGYVGIALVTVVGTITTGNGKYTKDGSPIAEVGVSQWLAGPFSGTILGPGATDVILT